MEVIVEFFDKIEAVQYLMLLLTNQDKNFTKLVVFGHTLQIFSDLDTLTSMEVIVEFFDKTEVV